MATTYVEPLRSAAQRVDYTRGDDGERPLAEFCDLGDHRLFCAFCERERELHGRRVEAYGVRVSFDPAELSAQDAADVGRAMAYGRELCERIAPGHPCHVVAHGDGEGGALHLHIEIANSNALTGRALRENRSARRVRAIADDLCRDFGLSVIGETPERRGAWERSRGVEVGEPTGDGWKGKRGLPGVSDFDRTLGDAVADALAAASSLDEFKRMLSERGVSVSDVPQREKDPATGKRRDVVDPATGKPKIACWRYSMRDGGGRMRRRKDSNLYDGFRMAEVVATMEAREKAARLAEFRRSERAEAEKAKRLPSVDFAESAADLQALANARFTDALRAGVHDRDGEPVLRELRAACADDAAKRRAVSDLKREVSRAHASRPAEAFANERPGDSLAAVLSKVAAEARELVTRMLAAMWRMRIALERAAGRKATQEERSRLAHRVIDAEDKRSGTGIARPEAFQDDRQLELEFTYGGGRHLTL